MKINLAENIHVYPILASTTVTSSTATYTNFVKTKCVGQGMLELELSFGTCSATDSTGDYTITVVESSAGISTDTSYALPFMYRSSTAVGSDNLAAATTASTTGYAVLATAIDNTVQLLYVDMADVTREYVGALVTPSADSTSYIITGAVARFVPRYGQASAIACSTT